MDLWRDIKTVPTGEPVVVWAKSWRYVDDTFSECAYYDVIKREKPLGPMLRLNPHFQGEHPEWVGLSVGVCPTHWHPLLKGPK